MQRLISRLVPLIALSLVMSGCSNNNATVIAPTIDTSKTDSFSGTLTLNGSTAYPFTVTASGQIQAQLSELSPDSAKPVGVSLGTWNGSACQIVIDAPNAIMGSLVVGAASATGSFCVRIYDSTGTVVVPETYTVDVNHP
jgi:hypothetical protein